MTHALLLLSNTESVAILDTHDIYSGNFDLSHTRYINSSGMSQRQTQPNATYIQTSRALQTVDSTCSVDGTPASTTSIKCTLSFNSEAQRMHALQAALAEYGLASVSGCAQRLTSRRCQTPLYQRCSAVS